MRITVFAHCNRHAHRLRKNNRAPRARARGRELSYSGNRVRERRVNFSKGEKKVEKSDRTEIRGKESRNEDDSAIGRT